jgi:hypothetical protein
MLGWRSRPDAGHCGGAVVALSLAKAYPAPSTATQRPLAAHESVAGGPKASNAVVLHVAPEPGPAAPLTSALTSELARAAPAPSSATHESGW